MAKARTAISVFLPDAGTNLPSGWGSVLACKQWNTLVEEKISVTGSGMGGSAKITRPKDRPKPVAISTIDMKEEDRVSTGLAELDRVLGGGIMAAR